MPAARTEPRKAFKFPFPAFLKFPAVPKFPAFPALLEIPPGPLSARLFVGLGVLLSAAMPFWPVRTGGRGGWWCTWPPSRSTSSLVSGVRSSTWDERLPAAHTIAVGIVLWGVGLLAAETVPRLPYV